MRRCPLRRTYGPRPCLASVMAAGVLWAMANGPLVVPAAAANCSTGTIELLSRADDGSQANGTSVLPAADGDGCVVAFKSDASNLASDTHHQQFNVFVRDRNAGTTTRAPVSPEPNEGSFPPALNACVPALCSAANDGQFVAFASLADNLVPLQHIDFNQSPDIFVYDRSAVATEIETVALDGLAGGGAPDEAPSLCADGTRVAFTSSASHLVGNLGNGSNQVYTHDRVSGTNTLVSMATVGAGQGQPAPGDSGGAAISGDGCVVAFYSNATSLVAGYRNDTCAAWGCRRVFARDLCADPPSTEMVSVSNAGALPNGGSQVSGSPPGLSYDGRYVAFSSDASNLEDGDDNGVTDVFVRDRCQVHGQPVDGCTASTIRVSKGPNGEDGPSQFPSLSADGRFVVFQSAASNLVPDDTNGKTDIFVVDITGGMVRPAMRVSVSSSGAQADGDSTVPQISGDGLSIVFQSDADNLVDGDSNGGSDIFVTLNPPTPTPTATPTPMTTNTPTPSVTPEGPTATAVVPSPTGTTALTPTVTVSPGASHTPSTGGGTATPTASLGTATPTAGQPSPTASAGGGGGASSGGGGGGCSCGIDPGANVGPDPSALIALGLPLLLQVLRNRRRRP